MNSILKCFAVLCGISVLMGCSEPKSVLAPVPSAESSGDVKNGAAEKKASIIAANEYPSALISDKIKYNIYLPPSYAAEQSRAYPVIYWLHGSGGYPPGALQMLASRFHGAIQAGTIPELIVVFPDGLGQSMWLNSKDNRLPMEDIIIQELIPHIDNIYRTLPSREGRILEGGSMGGYGAARFAFKYPEMFAAVSMLNPGPMQPVLDVSEAPIVGREGAQKVMDRVYGNDMEYFQAQSPWQLAEDKVGAIRNQVIIRLLLGEDDQITANNIAFSERLKALNIDHDVVLLANAGHNPREMFSALGPSYWDFFNQVLGE